MHSHSTCIQASGHIVNFITTTTSQYHNISPLQNCFLELIVEPYALPTRYPVILVNEAPHPNLLPVGKQWLQRPTIPDTSAVTHSRPDLQPSQLDKYHPNYK
ncbi:heat shock transcription factor, Y-linked-like [Pongo abelii]